MPPIFLLSILSQVSNSALFDAETIIEFVRSYNQWMVVVFWLSNLLAVLLFLPLTLFWIVGGLLFGPLVGTLLTTTAATVGAAVAFLFSRKYEIHFSKFVVRYSKAKELKDKLETTIAQNNFLIIFVVRMLPHPFILLSYIAGLISTISFRPYILATLLAMSILSFCFVSFGDSLMKGPEALIVPGIAILLVTQLPKLLNKFVMKNNDKN